MKFGVTTKGKRFQFTIQGFNHLRELVSRIYEVNTSAELNIWYNQLSEAKIKEYSPRGEQDDFQDLSDETRKYYSKDCTRQASEIIPNHGFKFWEELYEYLKKTRLEIQQIIVESNEIKEELLELEYRLNYNQEI